VIIALRRLAQEDAAARRFGAAGSWPAVVNAWVVTLARPGSPLRGTAPFKVPRAGEQQRRGQQALGGRATPTRGQAWPGRRCRSRPPGSTAG